MMSKDLKKESNEKKKEKRTVLKLTQEKELSK